MSCVFTIIMMFNVFDATLLCHVTCVFQLTRLQEENDSLVGKHSKHSQQLQDEHIDLPNTVEVSLRIHITQIVEIASLSFVTGVYCNCIDT